MCIRDREMIILGPWALRTTPEPTAPWLSLIHILTCAAAGHPVLAVFAAMAAGACAGYVTAFLQTRMGVPSILAGIITNTGLYTVNLMVMGWSSNVSLLKQDTKMCIRDRCHIWCQPFF